MFNNRINRPGVTPEMAMQGQTRRMANARMTNSLALPPGTDLIGEFRIERVLGAGGFGMTYLAQEVALARAVTIKEYFPTDFAQRLDGFEAAPRDEECVADFQWGLDRFIDEAQTLARFDHPHIVRVFRYFKANGTAYMVLSFEEGQSLKGWLRGLSRAPRQRELDDFLSPLLDALETIHAADYLHRDIAPDNIIIRKDGTPVLIDFGSARGEIAARTRTVSALVKPGYSPYEQYAESGARQGPWTDIYALGATLYHAVCGKRPPDAPSRVVRDDLVPVRDAVLASYRSRFLDAIERAIALDPGKRPQSIAAWRGDLLAPEPPKPNWFRRATQQDLGPAGAKIAGRNQPLPRALGPQPPLPDVPGAPGQMLDFIEGLQQKAPPVLGEPAKPVSANPKPVSKPSRPATLPPQTLGEKAPAAVKSKPPRPRAMPGSRSARWRSFALKFTVGAGLAGAALLLNDGLPVRETKPSGPATALGGKARDVTVARAAAARELTERDTAPRETALRVALAAPRPRLTMLPGHRGGTASVSFTADGSTVVTAGADGTLKVWNATTGEPLRTIALDGGAATATAVDGRRALTGHADGRLAIWDIDSGTRLAAFKRGDAAISAAGFTREGDRVLAAGQDGMLAIWDPSQPAAPAEMIEAHDGTVSAIAIAPRGSLAASGGADNQVHLWRSGTLDPVRTYRGHKAAITALAFSPNGRYLAAAAEDGRIRVWSTSSSSLYRLSSAHKGSVRGLAFSPDGGIIASAGDDGSVQLWQVRQSRAVRSIGESGSPARSLAFAPDGTRAAVASADGSVRFWEAGVAGRPAR
jgi:WD40 repeat protein/serine/threonine protein kinase